MNSINGFTFYKSYYECLTDLEEKDKQEILYAMLEYVFEDKEPSFVGFKNTIWVLIKPNLTTSKSKSNNAKKEQKEIKQKSNENQKEIKQKHSPLDKEEEEDKEYNITNIYNKVYYNNKELNNIFIEYLKLRKKLKAVNSETAIKLILNKLNNYEDDVKIKMIENSIQNSWKSVYENKGNNKATKPEWFDKNIETENATDEEQKEMKELMKDFK